MASDSSGNAQRGIADPLIGQVINDRFRILSILARGGMGRVYRAEQVPLGRRVAIKTLDPREHGAENDPQFQQRFFLEASIASKLQHPNTVTVFDYGRTAAGQYFIAMELVEGAPLNQVIRLEKRLAPARVAHIALQIARSLREAHRLDVIHRDLKPANVLLTRHGDEEDFVKVLDFGLVKQVQADPQEQLTRAGLFMGSPKYMAPEQIRGERVDARCDIYALGVCMYEMLLGRVPFDSENTVSVLMAHIHEEVPPINDPTIAPALANLVMRCLAKQPDDRPASMDEVIFALKQAIGAPTNVSGSFPLSGELHIPAASGMLRVRPSPETPVVLSSVLPQPTPPQPLLLTQRRPPSSPDVIAPPESPQLVATLSAPPEHAPSSLFPKVAVLLALIFAGWMLALRITEPRKAARPVAIPLATAASADSTAPVRPATPEMKVTAEAAAAQEAHVTVKLTSTPPNARVYMGDRDCGTTPTTLELHGEQATEGREIGFRFERPGYVPATSYRIVRGVEMTVDATLPPRATRKSKAERSPE